MFGQPSKNCKVAIGTVTALAVILYLRSRLRITNAPASQYLKKGKLPERVKFIGAEEYAVLSAIVDAFLPSRSLQECKMLLDKMIPGTVYSLLDKNLIAKNNTFLCAGAINYGTNRHVAETIQAFCTKEEQTQLYWLLAALSTSVGCFSLTGYPVPFQDLPLDDRQSILRSFSTSNLAVFRNVFQTFRRLAGDLFFSYAEPGQKNPYWDALDYVPEMAISNKSHRDDHDHDHDHEGGKCDENNKSTCEAKPSKDALLRSMISYDYVTKALRNKKESTDEIDVLNVDIVIIGSGSGGGTVAHQLVSAGFQVLVVEKNGYYRSQDFQAWRECEAMANAYDKGGLITTVDGAINILAGSCVGGGSTINWSASFAPPKAVVQDWAASGLADFQEGGEFHRSLAKVHELFHINSDFSYYDADEAKDKTFAVNENNRALWKGAEALGYKVEKIPRNVTQCVNCGHCCYGCSHESKQSTIHGLLEPLLMTQHEMELEAAAEAKQRAAEGKHSSFTAPAKTAPKQGKLYILPDCNIDRILHQRGDKKEKKAIGAEGIVTFYAHTVDGKVVKESVLRVPEVQKKIRILSNLVVCSAGSIQTPALLLRSSFKHPMIGRNLTLHPVVPCAGEALDTHTEMNGGVSMGVVIKDAVTQYAQFTKPHKSFLSLPADFNTAQYPIAIETPPAHVGIVGLILPWKSDLGYKLSALSFPHILAFLQFPRDHCYPHNRVTIDAQGHPVIHYTLSREDEANIMNGLEITMRMMKSSTKPVCKALMMSNIDDWWYWDEKKSDTENDAAFEAYVQQVRKAGIVPCTSTLFSAHQMSSCRMSFDPKEGPTSPNGELYECENCFVADGSVLPSSLGINPMITIESTAHMIAQKIIRHMEDGYEDLMC